MFWWRGVHYFTYSDFKKPPKSGSGFHPHVPFEKLIHPDQNAQETDFQARNISDTSQLEAWLSGPESVRKTRCEDYLAKPIHGDFTKVISAQAT